MTSAFALALLSVDGLGRTTAHRILERFPSWDAVRETPHEQLRLRIKGAPNTDRLVETLLDEAFEADALAPARRNVEALAARGIRTVSPGAPDWPASLDALDRSDRPVVLYLYGAPVSLDRPALACLGRPPIEAEAFEAAQALARVALERGAGLVVGASSGFDVALQKLSLGAGRAATAVLGCGLAKLTPSLRPAATALTRGGGLLVSPFPMTHGPFDHDDRERARVQAALGRAVLAVGATEGSPERGAVDWAAAAGRPVRELDGRWSADAVWTELWPDAPGPDAPGPDTP